VAALPEGQRAAVARFSLAGLTHAEIAADLGISVGAVKTRLHRGRRPAQRRAQPGPGRGAPIRVEAAVFEAHAGARPRPMEALLERDDLLSSAAIAEDARAARQRLMASLVEPDPGG